MRHNAYMKFLKTQVLKSGSTLFTEYDVWHYSGYKLLEKLNNKLRQQNINAFIQDFVCSH